MNYNPNDLVIGEWKKNTMKDFRYQDPNQLHDKATDKNVEQHFNNFVNFRQYTNQDSHTNNHQIRMNDFMYNPSKFDGKTMQEVYDSLTTEFNYSQKSPELDRLFGIQNKPK